MLVAPSMPNSTPQALQGPERARTGWRCRRGMRELDLLLCRWFDVAYDGVSPEERRRFAHLLELPDPQLADYLLAGVRPADAQLANLVDAIRSIMSSGAGTFGEYS